MNMIILFQSDFTGPETITLWGRRKAHLENVNRVKPGDTLKVGLLNHQMGKGTVTSISEDSIQMSVDLTYAPPLPLPLTLILALPRPKMLKRILQTTASLGIKEIYLINTWRVEKSFWSSPLLYQKNLEKELILGLEQAKDTLLPKIHLKRLFMPFITEDLPDIIEQSSQIESPPLLLTTHPGEQLPPCPEKVKQRTILAMGPEGGFIDKEIASLEKAGFKTVQLGNRILRLETAIPYVTARLFK
ncbi:conserved hypothetical protein [Desulfamplus magnetovallimortis]|uniref:Ribosomal RNA small subunit methyltransferase E n=1 Tax=Desulfamplus magnetovallimortis TaxID=1246637 RepID=A0A1W1H976_9BACT|nr:16S rRNA (uracil(1498)-N(3))-methyltransferase [Desulfamplus magnetovallimortis]SLM28999.1 conserved hypothetical protein [Desulfamplus magnetovallimortis]